MERIIETRRDFLKQASLALTLPLIFGCGNYGQAQVSGSDLLGGLRANAISDPNCGGCGARDVPTNVSWRTKLAPASDKGERILINGTVYGPDGRSPVADTLIYLYHTDIYGIYGRNAEHKHGRYRGWMLTDERGRYEFESIMPASYPDSTIAKHIHMTVTGLDKKEDSIDLILFEGDRFLTASERIPRKGGFDPVLKLVKNSDGISRGVRDIRLG